MTAFHSIHWIFPFGFLDSCLFCLGYHSLVPNCLHSSSRAVNLLKSKYLSFIGLHSVHSFINLPRNLVLEGIKPNLWKGY